MRASRSPLADNVSIYLLFSSICCYIFQSTLYLEIYKANVDAINACEHYILLLQTVYKIVNYVKGVITPNKMFRIICLGSKNRYFGQLNSSRERQNVVFSIFRLHPGTHKSAETQGSQSSVISMSIEQPC